MMNIEACMNQSNHKNVHSTMTYTSHLQFGQLGKPCADDM